jgi:DNA invertase Pin-like site-specific DNA recombinase
MLQRLATDGAKTIIVESPDRFARDLAVQLAGHDMLKGLGISIIPASAPGFFTEDTPTAVLVRQVLGAIAQFEKASIVRSWQQLGNASVSVKDGAREESLSVK